MMDGLFRYLYSRIPGDRHFLIQESSKYNHVFIYSHLTGGVQRVWKIPDIIRSILSGSILTSTENGISMETDQDLITGFKFSYEIQIVLETVSPVYCTLPRIFNQCETANEMAEMKFLLLTTIHHRNLELVVIPTPDTMIPIEILIIDTAIDTGIQGTNIISQDHPVYNSVRSVTMMCEYDN
ncbi:hypothetical protein BDB01DRAFT_883433 [Pilobolus umbonatus]|nr:hypothetical protein BDB01DRAFT_883433 [Pilobolus umbonatus]